jgi:YesN/AraC family two-component response regulator
MMYSVFYWLAVVIIWMYGHSAVAQDSVSMLQSSADQIDCGYLSGVQTEQTLFSATADSLLYEAYKKRGDHERALRYLESFHLKIRNIEQKQLTKAVGEQADTSKSITNEIVAANQRSVWVQRLPIGAAVSMLLLFLGIFLRFTRLGFGHKYVKPSTRDRTVYQKRIQESAQKQATTQKSEAEAAVEDRRELYEDMLRLIEVQKLYLNPDLTQKVVVTLLGTNRNYLYQAISQHTDEHFTQIVNRYRVKEAQWLLEQRAKSGDESSPEEVYIAAGFNSVTSYYRAFKYFTGLTPRDYQMAYRQDYVANNKKGGTMSS